MNKRRNLLLLLPSMMLLSACGSAPHEHTFSNEWSMNDTSHWHKATCEHTEFMKDLANHLDENKDGKCDVCHYDIPIPPTTHEHTFSNEWSMNDTSHWHKATCEHSEMTKDLENHIDADKNGICDVCLYEIVVPPVPHEHTFSNTYSYNESCHWYDATCEHTELTSGLEEHTFINGVCKCGYEEPQPQPIPEQTYYLPFKDVEYLNGSIKNLIEYSYDEDLLGYSEFTKFADENGELSTGIKRTYRYNEDFSIETIDTYSCGIDEQTKDMYSVLTNREIYHYYENDSYTEEEYYVDPFNQTFEYRGKTGHFYDEFGNETLHYQLDPIEESDDMEIFIYYETIYDEKHREIRENSYAGTLENKVLDGYNITVYNDSESTALVTEYLYDTSSEEFVIDGYQQLVFEELDGISYCYQQMLDADMKEGNLNKYGYDAQGTKVLLNYNNREIKEIKENDNFQIVKYTYQSDNGDLDTMNVSYNEQSLISSTSKYTDFAFIDDVKASTSYVYNESKQMVEVVSSYIVLEKDPLIENMYCKISYTDIENEELYLRVGLHKRMYRVFSDEVLDYGIY